MLFRKYLAFVPSTSPWIWCCVLTWWIDRFLMELGHRSSSEVLCTHSDIQYVQLHQYITCIACLVQIIYSVRERVTQFKREAQLMGIDDIPCQLHIYIIQSLICTSWTTVIVCLIDVSPWLCLESVVQNRASIAALAICCIMCSLPAEAWLWDRLLQRALFDQSGPMDI